MQPPVPKAPEGYEEPIWRHDTIDVLIVIDRSSGFEPLEVGKPLTHPIDQFVGRLDKRLQALDNIPTHVVATDEVVYEEDLPTGIYAVVTNDPGYAKWWSSRGGNLVEVDVDGDSLVLTSRGESERFGPEDEDQERAVVFAEGGIVHPFDSDGLDAGPSLLEPITSKELSGTEKILDELWQAIDNDELTETQRTQIIAMAELIQAQRRSTTPDETERWKLIGTIRAALTFLATVLPARVLNWVGIVKLLHDIDWSTLAGQLPL